jgi:hypothetical protein
MKKLTLLFLFSPLFLFSQEKKEHLPDSLRNWHRGGMIGLNFSQSSYTNWASGGVNSISGQALFNAYLNYKKDSTISWDNNLDLAYGLLRQGTNAQLRKTDDKIDFTSKYGHYAFAKVYYYSALLGFKTQFQPGYNYTSDTSKTLISDFMSPGYLTLAFGLDYKPNKKISVLVAPLTGRTTFVFNPTLADAGAFGVEKAEYDTAGNKIKDGQHIRNEFGGYIRAQYKAEVMTNVTLGARVELFSNYLDRPQNIDVNAEVLLALKVNKYISVSVNVQAIYDNDVNIAIDTNHDGVIDATGPRLQFREVLGIGLSAKF